MPSNDNTPDEIGRAPSGVDAHGQAALLLIESLIHGLIERSMLTSADAIEIIESVVDIQGQIAETADGAGATMWQAQGLLERMAASLKLDLRDTPTLNQ